MAEGENQASGGESSNGSSGTETPGFIRSGGAGLAKRGRPPGSTNRKNLETGSSEKTRATASASPDSLESAKFIGVGVVALIELGESFVHSSCARKIEKRFPAKLEEFKSMALALGLQEKDKELISDCATKIAQKHELLTKYAPEVVLGVTLAQYALRQATLMRFVDNVTKVKLVPEVKPNETPPAGA